MRSGFIFGFGLAIALGTGLAGHPAHAAGGTGFSEVYVPQVKGKLPPETPKPAQGKQSSEEAGQKGTASGGGTPLNCGPENAQSPECQKIIQRSQSLAR